MIAAEGRTLKQLIDEFSFAKPIFLTGHEAWNLFLALDELGKTKEHRKKLHCPHCGNTNMVLVAQAYAHFKVDENGRMGDAILDKEGIDCINETVELASAKDGDIEFKCRHCRSSFAAKTTDHEYTYEVGEEL